MRIMDMITQDGICLKFYHILQQMRIQILFLGFKGLKDFSDSHFKNPCREEIFSASIVLKNMGHF